MARLTESHTHTFIGRVDVVSQDSRRLTYRDNEEDRERVLIDLERLRRMLSRGGYSMPYVVCWNAKSAGRSIRI